MRGSGEDHAVPELTWFANQVVRPQEDFTSCGRKTNDQCLGLSSTSHFHSTFLRCLVNEWRLFGRAGLTVGPEEGRREEALVHQTRERNNANHVVGVKGQTAERLAAQLLCEPQEKESAWSFRAPWLTSRLHIKPLLRTGNINTELTSACD